MEIIGKYIDVRLPSHSDCLSVAPQKTSFNMSMAFVSLRHIEMVPRGNFPPETKVTRNLTQRIVWASGIKLAVIFMTIVKVFLLIVVEIVDLQRNLTHFAA